MDTFSAQQGMDISMGMTHLGRVSYIPHSGRWTATLSGSQIPLSHLSYSPQEATVLLVKAAIDAQEAKISECQTQIRALERQIGYHQSHINSLKKFTATDAACILSSIDNNP